MGGGGGPPKGDLANTVGDVVAGFEEREEGGELVDASVPAPARMEMGG